MRLRRAGGAVESAGEPRGRGPVADSRRPANPAAKPVATDPMVTDPTVTDPTVMDPTVMDPAVTDPAVTRPTAALAVVLVAAAAALLVTSACGRRGGAPPRDALQEAFREDGLTAVEAHGHRLFLARCATCHGVEGHGDGQNAYNLSPPPPDFAESLAQVTPPDRRRIVEGGTSAVGRSPLCPPNGRALRADEVDAIVAWLAVASRPAPAAPEGEASPRSWRPRKRSP